MSRRVTPDRNTPSDEHPPIERWFVRRGVPHFIANYTATEDVFTRALPVLILFFLLSSVSGINLDWGWWQVVGAIVGGLVVLLASWVALNKYRGRSYFALPNRVGWPEIALLVLVPSILPLIFGVDWIGAMLILANQILVVLLIYIITSYGLVAISIWAIGRLVKTLGQTFQLFTRSLPLLLIGFMFLFINAEAWQSAGELDPALLWTIITAFAVFAGIFLGTQIPKELRSQRNFASNAEVVEIADDAPTTWTSQVDSDHLLDPPPLSRRERANLWLIVFVTQGFRLLLVSVLIGLVFVCIGLLMIRPETIALWTNRAPTIWWDLPWDLFGNDIAVTTQLLQVSAFLGAFAAVYFSVYAATDKTLRTEFFDDTLSEIRQNLAARSIYRAQLSKQVSGQQVSGSGVSVRRSAGQPGSDGQAGTHLAE